LPKNKVIKALFLALGQITTILRNLDFIFHKHGVNRLALKKIFRPRPGSPFVQYERGDGSKRYLWCTFSPNQIDLNIKSVAVKRKFRRDIRHLEGLGVNCLRLDAVAYVGKQRGTTNFMIPKTINFITWLAKHAHEHKMLVLPEVHHYYKTQLSLSQIKGVDYVYDFALPLLILHALFYGNGKYLKKWLKIRPENIISVLDTHDGIGIIDAEGLLAKKEIEKTSKKIIKNGGNIVLRANGSNSSNVDVYQINCTYYSALGKKNDAYIVARAIQLFLPGIPQIYYVGLFAGKNDGELLKKTKIGRDINRHFYSLAEIKEEMKRDVVKKLLSLCKLRNSHPAFQGSFGLQNTADNIIEMCWKNNKEKLKLEVDLKTYKIKVT
jgi:sucrose phosphorylase